MPKAVNNFHSFFFLKILQNFCNVAYLIKKDMKNKTQYRAILMVVDEKENPQYSIDCTAFYDEIEDLLDYLHLNRANIEHLALQFCEALEVSSLSIRMGLEVNAPEKVNCNYN